MVRLMEYLYISLFSIISVTLTFGHSHHGRYAFQSNITYYILAKYDVSAINTIWDISDFNETVQFSRFSMETVTLTFWHSHHGRYAFQSNITYYILAKYNSSAINTIWDISDFMKLPSFHDFQWTPWPSSLGKVTMVGMLKKVISHTTFWQSMMSQ